MLGTTYGAHPPDTIAATLRHHDQQLASLTTKVGGIESTLGTVVSSLSDIRTAVTRSEATRPASLPVIVSTLSQIGGSIALLVTGVVWLTISLTKPNVEAAGVRDEFMRFRIEQLEADAKSRLALERKRFGAGIDQHSTTPNARAN